MSSLRVNYLINLGDLLPTIWAIYFILLLLLILIQKETAPHYICVTNECIWFLINISYRQQRQVHQGGIGGLRLAQTYEPPEKDSSEDIITTNSEEESCTADDSAYTVQNPDNRIVHLVICSINLLYVMFLLYKLIECYQWDFNLQNYQRKPGDRHSVAASYLAAATAALSGPRRWDCSLH